MKTLVLAFLILWVGDSYSSEQEEWCLHIIPDRRADFIAMYNSQGNPGETMWQEAQEICKK